MWHLNSTWRPSFHSSNLTQCGYFDCCGQSGSVWPCRLTVAFTPLVAKLTGSDVSKKEWGAAAVGVLGGVLISVDSALRSGSGESTSSVGELY